MLESNLVGSARLSDSEMMRKYTDQPHSLPAAIRQVVEERWGRGAVLLYAFIDLNARYQLSASWLLLSETEVALIAEDGATHFVARSNIRSLREVGGLSANRLMLEGDGFAEPL